MSESMRIIFLDVDGVLNSKPQLDMYKKLTEDDYYSIYNPYLRNLHRVYRKYPNTKIVLSLPWDVSDVRKKYLAERLAKYGMDIYDVVLKTDTEGNILDTRPEQILDWLSRHNGVTHWVSIEDDYDEDDYYAIKNYANTHLCKTEYGTETDDINDCGLNIIKAHVALDILGRQDKKSNK